MILRAFCETSNVLQIFYFINMIVKILCYVVPAILILMLTIDIFKNVMSGEDNVIKNNMKMIIKRTIFAVAIFFVPMIVNISFGLLGNMNVSAAKCYNNANLSTIQSLKEKEAKEYEEYKEKKKAETQEKIKQERQEQQDMIRENASGSSSDLAGKIVSVAKQYACSYGTSSKVYDYRKGGKGCNGYAEAYKKSKAHSNYDASTARGTCCCHFSKFVISTALGGKKAPNVLTLAQNNNIKAAEKYGFTTMELTTNSEIKPGDIISYVKKDGGGHVVIAIGNGKIAEAGHRGVWPHISKLNVKYIYNTSKRAFIVRPK